MRHRDNVCHKKVSAGSNSMYPQWPMLHRMLMVVDRSWMHVSPCPPNSTRCVLRLLVLRAVPVVLLRGCTVRPQGPGRDQGVVEGAVPLACYLKPLRLVTVPLRPGESHKGSNRVPAEPSTPLRLWRSKTLPCFDALVSSRVRSQCRPEGRAAEQVVTRSEGF